MTSMATVAGTLGDHSKKKQLAIHRIRELQLDYVDIEANYDVIKEIGSGDYGKVILATHKKSKFEVGIGRFFLLFVKIFPHTCRWH